MSLLQLLSVGRSFKETLDRPAYREHHSLPRFEPPQPRPSAAQESAQTKPSAARLQPSLFSELIAAPSRGTAAPVKPALPASAPEKSDNLPPVAEVTPAPAPAAPARVAEPSKPLFPIARKEKSWKSMIKELFSLGRSRRSPQTIIQTELALQNVTVLRNDLSDSDLELVAGRPKSADTTPKLAFERRQTKNWIYFTTRLFRSDKNVFQPAPPAASSVANKTPELITRT